MKLKTQQLTIDALLAAMCAILGTLVIPLGIAQLSFESLPVLFSALMYGPIDGMLVGGIGTLLSQVIRYGWQWADLIWMMPFILVGYLLGLYARRHNYNNTVCEIRISVVISELVLFILNTGAIYLDFAVINTQFYTGKTFYEFILIPLIPRFFIAIVKSIVLGSFMHKLLKRMSYFTHNGRRGKMN